MKLMVDGENHRGNESKNHERHEMHEHEQERRGALGEMNMRTWLVAGALLGFVGVALGSFGAHGLEKALAARGLDAGQVAERLHNWDVAVRYQMVQALVLLIVGLLAARSAALIPTNQSQQEMKRF